jgi:TonB family protein
MFCFLIIAAGQQEGLKPTSAPPPSGIKPAATVQETAQSLFDQGLKAVQEGRYDDSVSRFSEGIELAPDQPALWLGRSEARFRRSQQRYTSAIDEIRQLPRDPSGALPRPNFWPAQEELQASLSDADRAVALTRDLHTPVNQLIGASSFPNLRAATLGTRFNTLHLLVSVYDKGRAEEAVAAFQEYMTLEADETRRSTGTLSLARLMIEVGRPELALSTYQQILSRQADHVEATLGEAISLISLGVRADDQAQTQKGMDSLKKFTEIAPEKHPYRDSALEAVEFLAEMKTEMADAENKGSAADQDRTGKRPLNGSVLNGKAVSLPKPTFPVIARFARANGSIKVQVLIDEEGTVARVVSVSGHPLLQIAAAAAARQAKFTPTMVGGLPVKVTGHIIYNFTAMP